MGFLEPHERHGGQAGRSAVGQLATPAPGLARASTRAKRQRSGERTAVAFVVHRPEHAAAALHAALEAGRAVALVSPPAAAGSLGPAWFRELVAAAQTATLSATETADQTSTCEVTAILDCGRAPGYLLAALRAGVKVVIFTGRPALRRKLTELAATRGAVVLPQRLPALDLEGLADPLAACRARFRTELCGDSGGEFGDRLGPGLPAGIGRPKRGKPPE